MRVVINSVENGFTVDITNESPGNYDEKTFIAPEVKDVIYYVKMALDNPKQKEEK